MVLIASTLMRYAKAVFLWLCGLAILATTVVVTIDGTKFPSPAKTIAIALLGAIGVPIGLGALGVARRVLQRPDAALLREEAEARRRTAAALEDAETAEKLKTELDAYVALRARRLEIEWRRQELKASATSLLELHHALNTAERHLGVAQSELDPEVTRILDEIMGLAGSDVYRKLTPYVGMLDRMVSIFLPFLGRDALIDSFEDFMRMLDRRRLRKLAKLAPAALSNSEPPTQS